MKKVLALIMALALAVCCCACDSDADKEESFQETLAGHTCEMINALTALSTDDVFLETLGLPDDVLGLLSVAEAYDTAPALTVAYPDDHATRALLPTIYNFYYYMGDDHIVLSSAIPVQDSFLCNATELPAYAVYAPADGAEGDAIYAAYTCANGTVTVSVRWLPYDLFCEFMNPDSTLSQEFASAGVEIDRSGDYPALDAQVMPPIFVPEADEAWIAETALEIAEAMVANSSNIEYLKLYTTDPAILDICYDVGNIHLGNASVGPVTYYDSSSVPLAARNENHPLLDRYYLKNIAVYMIQGEINQYGAVMVAASAICTYNDAVPARADFKSCSVIIESGGDYNIAVTFSITDNGVALVSAKPFPAN